MTSFDKDMCLILGALIVAALTSVLLPEKYLIGACILMFVTILVALGLFAIILILKGLSLV